MERCVDSSTVLGRFFVLYNWMGPADARSRRIDSADIVARLGCHIRERHPPWVDTPFDRSGHPLRVRSDLGVRQHARAGGVDPRAGRPPGRPETGSVSGATVAWPAHPPVIDPPSTVRSLWAGFDRTVGWDHPGAIVGRLAAGRRRGSLLGGSLIAIRAINALGGEAPNRLAVGRRIRW